MSGQTYFAHSTTDENGLTSGYFMFLGKQDRYTLDKAREITGLPIKRNQYKSGEPIRFRRGHEAT